MLVTKLIAVLKARPGSTADWPAGLNGSSACRRMQRVERQEAGQAEQQHGDGVGDPALLALLVDAAQPVDARARPGASTGDRKVRSPSKTRVM